MNVTVLPSELLGQLVDALTDAHAALFAHDDQAFAAAIERKSELLARLLPHTNRLRDEPALAPRVAEAARQHAALAALLAMRQAQVRGRLEALGVQPTASTYGAVPSAIGRSLGIA